MDVELVGAVAAGREHVRAVRHNQGVFECLRSDQYELVVTDIAFDDAFSRNYDR